MVQRAGCGVRSERTYIEVARKDLEGAIESGSTTQEQESGTERGLTCGTVQGVDGQKEGET